MKLARKRSVFVKAHLRGELRIFNVLMTEAQLPGMKLEDSCLCPFIDKRIREKLGLREDEFLIIVPIIKKIQSKIFGKKVERIDISDIPYDSTMVVCRI